MGSLQRLVGPGTDDGRFTNHFLKYLLLQLDGHLSDFCPDTVHLATKEHVIIFALPPNITHITQSLDKGALDL